MAAQSESSTIVTVDYTQNNATSVEGAGAGIESESTQESEEEQGDSKRVIEVNEVDQWRGDDGDCQMK